MDTAYINAVQKNGAQALYFDLIPWDALENVVRFLSGLPRASDWRRKILAANIAPLFSVSGAAQAFVRSEFNTVYASIESLKYVHEEYRANNNIIWAYRKHVVVDLILCGAEFIDSLVVDTIAMQDLREILDGRCPNLRRLSILNIEYANEAKRWLRKFGRNLECLEIENFHPSNNAVRAIERYCPHLRELNLRVLQEEHVTNTSLWKSLGNSLEILNVQFQFAGVEQVANIRMYCRKIKRICLEEVVQLDDYDEGINNAYVNCIASYGEDLETATVFDMSKNQLERIVSSCSDARFCSHVSRFSMLLPTLGIIGDKLEKVDVEYGRNWGESDVFAAAWRGCTNLQEFRMVDALAVRDMGCFMAEPKLKLRKIDIRVGHNQDVKQFVDIIAEGTGELEIVDLRCLVPPPNAFDKLVSKNKERLASVTIWSDTELGTAEMNVARMLETFLRAPAVHCIEINDWHRAVRLPVVGRICRAHLHRRVCVSILGVQYMK